MSNAVHGLHVTQDNYKCIETQNHEFLKYSFLWLIFHIWFLIQILRSEFYRSHHVAMAKIITCDTHACYSLNIFGVLKITKNLVKICPLFMKKRKFFAKWSLLYLSDLGLELELRSSLSMAIKRRKNMDKFIYWYLTLWGNLTWTGLLLN